MPNGGVHERGLQVDREHDGQPHHVDTHAPRDRSDERQHDEGDFEEVEKEGEQKDRDIEKDQEPDLACRQMPENLLDPDMAVEAPEHEGEERSAEQKKDNGRAKEAGRHHRAMQRSSWVDRQGQFDLDLARVDSHGLRLDNELRHGDQQGNHEQLQGHERNGAPVDTGCRH